MRLRLKPLTFSNLSRTLPYHYRHNSARMNALYNRLLAAENSGELAAMREALDEFNHAAEGSGIHAIEGESGDNLYLYAARKHTPYDKWPTLVYDLDRGVFGIGRITRAVEQEVLHQETRALMRRSSGAGGYGERHRLNPPPRLRSTIDTPTMGERALAAFLDSEEGRYLTGRDYTFDSYYEHGQWWILCHETSAAWAVVDAVPGIDGFDFEQVSAGEED